MANPYSEMKKHLKSLWDDRNEVEHNKIKSFLSELKKTEYHEAIFYFERYLEIKKTFQDHGLMNKSNTEIIEWLHNDPSSRFYAKLHDVLNHCLEEDTQSSLLLAAMLTSMMKTRDEAVPLFEASCRKESDFIKKLALDLGAYTYSKPSGETKRYMGATFVYDSYNDAKLLILISVDSNFLRRYGPQLFMFTNVLKDYHFHFHVVGNDTYELIGQSLNLIRNIRTFRGTDSIMPSFSTQEVPHFVASDRTYYACARFTVAEQVMDYYNKDIFIMDADLYFEDDPSSFFASFDVDVSLPITTGLRALSPWRRFMAGNVYLRNNESARTFLRHVVYYMNANLHKESSWMLDQNALAYGYEMSECVAFGTTKNRPTKQYPINNLFERK